MCCVCVFVFCIYIDRTHLYIMCIIYTVEVEEEVVVEEEEVVVDVVSGVIVLIVRPLVRKSTVVFFLSSHSIYIPK